MSENKTSGTRPLTIDAETFYELTILGLRGKGLSTADFEFFAEAMRRYGDLHVSEAAEAGKAEE